MTLGGPSVEDRDRLIEAGLCPRPEGWTPPVPEPEPSIAPAELEPADVEPAPVAAPAPSAVYKVRVLLGAPHAGGMGNVWHLLTAREPDRLHVTPEGMVDFGPWEPLDRPDASDRVLFLAASSVAGVSYRVASSPKAVAQALHEQPPAAEDSADPSTLVRCPATGCGETNVPRRFRCRRCGCNLASVKPKPKRRKASATDEAPTTADAVERVRSARARQCLSCGSWQTSRGAAACWQCNATLGDA